MIDGEGTEAERKGAEEAEGAGKDRRFHADGAGPHSPQAADEEIRKASMTKRMPEPATQDSDDPFARFELRSGIRRIRCTVSTEALDALLGLVAPSTALQRRQSFDRFRVPLNVVAQRKIDALPSAQSETEADAIRLTMSDVVAILGTNGVPRLGKPRPLQRHPSRQFRSGE